MMEPRRFRVGPLGISCVSMRTAVRTIQEAAQCGRPAYVCAANLRTTVIAQKDAAFCKIQNKSLLTLPDGMPLVWLGRIAGARVERVTGPDLFLELLGLSRIHGYSHFFCGDTVSTLAALRRNVEKKFPGVEVRGAISPPFRDLTDEETRDAAGEINRSVPTFVWVALGAPKQERWMARVLPLIRGSLLIGVGAAFRFVNGEYSHPPRRIQSLGLEGVWWRFAGDPLKESAWYCKHAPKLAWLMGRTAYARMRGRW